MTRVPCDICKKPVSISRVVVISRKSRRHRAEARAKTCESIDCQNKGFEKVERELANLTYETT